MSPPFQNGVPSVSEPRLLTQGFKLEAFSLEQQGELGAAALDTCEQAFAEAQGEPVGCTIVGPIHKTTTFRFLEKFLPTRGLKIAPTDNPNEYVVEVL